MANFTPRGGSHKKKLKLSGDFQGGVHEDGALTNHGAVKVQNAKGKIKATDTFLGTDHGSGSPLGELVATGGKKVSWTYHLDNSDPRVQALAAGETVHETYKLKVKNGGQTVSKVVHVTITGKNDAPEITSSAIASLEENQGTVLTVTATDADHNATQAFSIEAGADGALFQIDSEGHLSFIATPDFENDQSEGGGNTYHVTVGVSDGTVTTTQDIAVHVGDVFDPPVIGTNGGGTTARVDVDENVTPVATVSAAPGTITYSISGGDDAALFQIDQNTGALSFVSAPDFEAPADQDGDNDYEVVVKASDGSLDDTQTITVHVHNTNEAPVALNLSAESIDENNVPGAVVATLSATDQDALNFDLDAAGGHFSNAWDGADPTVACVGSPVGCDIGNKPNPGSPSPDATALSNFVIDHSGTFFAGGALPAGTYTQSVTLPGINSLALFTFTWTYDITPTVPSVEPLTAWEPAVDDGGFAGPFSYELVAGTGDDDNAAFTVDGDQLKLNEAANFEVKDSYSIHLKVIDAGGLSHEVTKVISVNNVNEAPVALSLSAESIDENNVPGAVVATLSATDQDALNFDLDAAGGHFSNAWDGADPTVACVGSPIDCDIGNKPNPGSPSPDATALSNFVIDHSGTFFAGGTLPAGTYSQSVTLPGNNSLALFTFTWTYDITPTVPSVEPLTAWEPAVDDGGFAGPFTFELVAGTGDDDNAAFTVDGDQLKLNEAANFEVKDSYSIHLKVTDAGGESFEVTKVITVIDDPFA